MDFNTNKEKEWVMKGEQRKMNIIDIYNKINDGNIKMLSINGVEPNIENIRNDKYPIVDNFYMIYRKDNANENIEKIKEFVLSDKGQKIIEDTGYVSINGY